jgi:hypothetical protein
VPLWGAAIRPNKQAAAQAAALQGSGFGYIEQRLFKEFREAALVAMFDKVK